MDFKDRHRVITDRPIYPNDCLPWLRLTMDERDRVLENNELRCKFCLKTLKPMTKGNSCGKGHHIYNTGRNGMCIDRNCDKIATVCRNHMQLNKDRHQLLRKSIEWADEVKPQPVKDNMSFLMLVNEDAESNSEKELGDMSSLRKEIQINTGQDPMETFDEIEHTTLLVVEDRRNNEAQFDLAYTNIDDKEILTTFDNCSNTTLVHKDLINEGKIQVLKTEESSSIKGIGGTAKGKVVEFEITNREGTRVRIKASVVDEIANVPDKDEQRYKKLIHDSIEEVKKAKGYEKATIDNFQLVPGGKIELLLGLDC